MTAEVLTLDGAACRALPAFADRIVLRARRHTLWMRALWSSDANAPAGGLAITHAEVDRILGDPVQAAAAERSFYQHDPSAGQLSAAIEAADRAAEHDQVWTKLRREFALSG